MELVENLVNFMCCFCDGGIDSSKIDPAEISVLINIDKNSDKQIAQYFYCHVACFKEKLSDAVRVHFHLHNILD
jgi:hypothetical protein